MTPSEERPAENPRAGRRIPSQLLACGWCSAAITVAAVGRTPKWCSSSCRHRAWEANRAAASGLVAVRIVDRPVAVEVRVPVSHEVEVPTVPRGVAWTPALLELAKQLETGRFYDRDLPDLVAAVQALLAALSRRPAALRLRQRPQPRDSRLTRPHC